MSELNPVDHEAEAVAHMAKQIREEEDERIRAALNGIATRDPESMSAWMTRMGEQPMRVSTMLMSEASYQDIVGPERNPSMGAIVGHTPCPDCEPCEHRAPDSREGFSDDETKRAFELVAQRERHLGPIVEMTDETRDAIFKLGRQSGKTETVTELMRENPEAVLPLPQHEGMSHSTAVAQAFRANYGPTSERLDIRVLRAAAEALHNTSVPLDEAKQQMMDAMENLTPDEIPLVQRELQKMLVKNGPARPINRAERRQVAKARRRA